MVRVAAFMLKKMTVETPIINVRVVQAKQKAMLVVITVLGLAERMKQKLSVIANLIA